MDVGERDARPRRRGRTRGRWPRGARARLVARRRNPRIRWGRWARGARAARPRLRGAVARQRLRRCACVAARTECAPPPRLNGARPQTCVFTEPWRPNSRCSRSLCARLGGQAQRAGRAPSKSARHFPEPWRPQPRRGNSNAHGVRTHMPIHLQPHGNGGSGTGWQHGRNGRPTSALALARVTSKRQASVPGVWRRCR